MPYYVGAGTPEWEEYLEGAQTESGEPPQSLFAYIEPSAAAATVLAFPAAPGRGYGRAWRTPVVRCGFSDFSVSVEDGKAGMTAGR